MALYLVHLAAPYGHARHYLGYTRDRDGWRLRCHANGTGANLLRYVRGAGIGWQLVRVWPAGDRTRERSLKGRGKYAACPLCHADAGHRVQLPDGRWLAPADPIARRGHWCRCGQRAAYRRPWGRGHVGLCWRCAGRYTARSTGATDAELAAGTYPPPARNARRRAA